MTFSRTIRPLPLTPRGFMAALILVFVVSLLAGILAGAWIEKARSCHERGHTCENMVDVD